MLYYIGVLSYNVMLYWSVLFVFLGKIGHF